MSLDNPLTRQWLDLIAYAEGTDPSRRGGGYDVQFGGGRFKGFDRHPDQVISRGGYKSAAAGRYQFMPGTWAEAAQAQGLQGFGPQQQDLGAIYLMRKRGVDPTKDPITAQNIAKLAPEWASLPTLQGKSYYGQPVKSLGELQAAMQRPAPGLSYVADPSVGAPTVSLPRFDMKGAMKDILTEFVMKGGGAPAVGDDQKAQVYLQAAQAIEENPEQFGEEGLAAAEEYRAKANEAMFSVEQPDNDPTNLVMNILGAKMQQKAYNQGQAAQEAAINAQLAALGSPSATTGIDPTAGTDLVALGKELQAQGFRVGEHPAFGRVGRHSTDSLHYKGRALDVTDWRPGDWKGRTAELGRQLQKRFPGAQIYHPGYDPEGGHGEHLHIGFRVG